MADLNISKETAQSYGYGGVGPSDSYINAQSEKGQKDFERQRYGRPRFQFPDVSQEQTDRNRLLNVLMGMGQGAQAAQGAAGPFAAFGMGIGGGIQGARTAMAQQDAAQLAKTTQEQTAMLNEGKIAEEMLNQTPIGQVSPQITQFILDKHKIDISQMPMKYAKDYISLVQKEDDLEKQLAVIKAKQEGGSAGDMSPQALRIASRLTGIPENELPRKRAELAALGLSPKPLTGETLKTYNNISDGALDLRQALDVYDKLTPEQIKLASIQGTKGKVFRALDEDAQKLNRLVANAADILSRQRTGAAINTNEERYYGALLNDFYSSKGQNRESLAKFLAFYEKVQGEMELGMRGPGVVILNKQRMASTTPAGPALAPAAGMVTLIAPNGEPFQVPQANVQAAIARGARAQ